MLAFRSVTTGLLGACLYLLTDLAIRVQPADTDGVELARVNEPSPYARTPPPPVPKSSETTGPGVTLIDVAPNVPAATVVGLVKIADHERIMLIGDRYVASNAVAGAEIASEIARGQRYIDLFVGGDGTIRRVIIVIHET